MTTSSRSADERAPAPPSGPARQPTRPPEQRVLTWRSGRLRDHPASGRPAPLRHVGVPPPPGWAQIRTLSEGMPRSNPRSTKARNTAPSNSRGPNQPPTHLLRPSCNEAYGYLRTRLCRLRDSSHRGDVSVDFRGFHDTRTTSVPPQRCGTKARTWWVSGGMEGVIDGGADRDRLPRGGHGPTSQGRGQPTARSPDTARAIIRNCEGSIWVATNPYRLVVGIIWGMFLGMLAGLGFGTGLGVVVGAGLGAVIAKVDRSGIDRKFQGRSGACSSPALLPWSCW